MSAKVAAIVGAGPGLGKSIATRFAKGGYTIALLNRKEESVKAAEESITSLGGKYKFFAMDATNADSVKNAFAELQATCGAPSVVVYNVNSGGFTSGFKGILGTTPEMLESVWKSEVLGALNVTQAALPAMLEKGHGVLLYSNATAGYRGSKGNPAIVVAKFGLRALAQSVAKEYACKGIHAVTIRLDCVIDTPGVRQYLGDRYDPTKLANPDDIAETYWTVHEQPKSAWSNEIDIRPYTEEWTY